LAVILSRSSRTRLHTRSRFGSIGVCVVVVVAALAQFGLSPRPVKHGVTLADLESLRTARDLALSPNGELLAYAQAEEVWLISTRGTSTPSRIAPGFMPVWSPDGKRLAYYSSRSGTLQLWMWDFETGENRQLTVLAQGIAPALALSGQRAELAYSWSPDSIRLVFATRDGRDRLGDTADEQKPSTDPGAPLIFTNTDRPGRASAGILRASESPSSADTQSIATQLFILDVRDGSITRLTDGQTGYGQPDWSPDGKRIVCSSPEGRPFDGHGPYSRNIYIIDAATGYGVAATTGSGEKSRPRWSPDGDHIAYLSGGAYSSTGIVVLPSTGGHPVDITSTLTHSRIYEWNWKFDGRAIVLHCVNRTGSPIVGVDIKTLQIEPIGAIDHEAGYQTLAVSHAGALAWVESTGATPWVIVFRDPRGTTRLLHDLNPQARDWMLGQQETIRWKNGHGEERVGLLIKPVGYDEKKRYPVIVSCYPFPAHANGFQGDVMQGNQSWAALGYVVFFPRPRAAWMWMNTTENAVERDALRGPKGLDITIDDVLSGADELVRRGIADPDRLGLYGFSNGGGVVNFVVTRTTRFRCAVSISGVQVNAVETALLEDRANTFVDIFVGGESIWENRDTYIAFSAVLHANRIKTPMLLASGDREDWDFRAGSVEMFLALRRLGRSVTLLRYPDQGHGFSGPALRDLFSRQRDFFAQHLMSEMPKPRETAIQPQ
jgi:dipeptidyl aminopeptidase/acylaminoacyl peptidase